MPVVEASPASPSKLVPSHFTAGSKSANSVSRSPLIHASHPRRTISTFSLRHRPPSIPACGPSITGRGEVSSIKLA